MKQLFLVFKHKATLHLLHDHCVVSLHRGIVLFNLFDNVGQWAMPSFRTSIDGKG